MFNQENDCARKQHFFFSFFFSPFQPGWFSSRLLHGSSWPLVHGASRRDVPRTCCWERAGWDCPFWQHSTLCCVAWGVGGWFWNLNWNLLIVCILGDDLYPLWLFSLFGFPNFKATIFPFEKIEIFPKRCILKCKQTYEVNLSLLLFLPGFALFPSLPFCLAWASPYPRSI